MKKKTQLHEAGAEAETQFSFTNWNSLTIFPLVRLNNSKQMNVSSYKGEIERL